MSLHGALHFLDAKINLTVGLSSEALHSSTFARQDQATYERMVATSIGSSLRPQGQPSQLRRIAAAGLFISSVLRRPCFHEQVKIDTSTIYLRDPISVARSRARPFCPRSRQSPSPFRPRSASVRAFTDTLISLAIKPGIFVLLLRSPSFPIHFCMIPPYSSPPDAYLYS